DAMNERVLVADDDRLSREFLVELVRRRGARVVAAEDGHAAARELEAQRFDLVLSDVRMPGLSGVEVARLARVSGNPAVILLTALGCVWWAVAALRAGAADSLLKPISPDELDRAIDRALGTRAAAPAAAPAREDRAPGALVGRSPALKDAIAR